MARKQVVVCDRCGKSGRLGSETQRFKNISIGSVETRGDTRVTTDKELCGTCVDDLLDLINQPPR